VASLRLKAQHAIRQLFDGNRVRFLLLRVLAYLVILAKYASQVAVAEKYCSGSPCSRDGRFLTAVHAVRRHDWGSTRMAKTAFSLKPVHAALARADVAGGKPRIQPCGAFLKFIDADSHLVFASLQEGPRPNCNLVPGPNAYYSHLSSRTAIRDPLLGEVWGLRSPPKTEWTSSES
jgi:hypothetical protein